MDVFPTSKRSEIMRQVRGRNTAPELVVRSVARQLGYRFRLHGAKLPGIPDLVFPSRKKAIFVHGCFWHGHRCARGARVPKTNRAYWIAKIARNRVRDRNARSSLRAMGWSSLVLWECQLPEVARIKARIRQFLEKSIFDHLRAKIDRRIAPKNG